MLPELEGVCDPVDEGPLLDAGADPAGRAMLALRITSSEVELAAFW